ncbi:MAG: M14 family metallopeptidase [Chloroflexi bacterium]|nr:M14 family metallopeptidase [Chloroflexota bacterium]
MSTAIDFGEYFDYQTLCNHLQGLADAYPALASLEVIGQSWRGRAIHCMTVTNTATGSHTDKPAFYIDAGIHAEEVATTQTAVYTIWYLLTNYGLDANVSWLLDKLAFYIIPRINPDGAEISLKTPHHWCGNGRHLPGEEQTQGLCQRDMNGDGFITQMRIRDPAGEWRTATEDPRLMILREAGEIGRGPYYRLYREGEIRGDWDGVNFEVQKPRDGNLNRNFPAGWRPEFRQYGAGEAPLSEPEARAIADFILDHPNIAGMQCYHSHGGLHLRPSLVAPDDSLPRADLALYKRIGAMGTALTGYPVISVYEEFTTDPDQPRVGSLMQWAYDEFGIITFSTELWNPELAAGIQQPAKYQVRARSTEDEITLLAYNDEHLDGAGFIDWQPFEHPQLGLVEIGGWTHMYTFRNPPPRSFATTEKARNFLSETLHSNCLFTLRHAMTAPLLNIRQLEAERLADDLVKLSALVVNEGFLPTHLTQRALAHGTAGAVEIALEAEDCALLMGSARQSIGHLAGRDERTATWSPWLPQWSDTSARIEWLLRAAPGVVVSVTASAQKGGLHMRSLSLP